MTFKVAVVGRPNVGKSTLFNRLVGKKIALVDDRPGVTRDRREGEAKLSSHRFTLIDTAGLEDPSDKRSLDARMQEQTEQAVFESDLVLFIYDAKTGVTPIDKHYAAWLRRQEKEIIIIANKCEALTEADVYAESYQLGFDEVIAISSEHGLGMTDLFNALTPHIKKNKHKEDRPDDLIQLVIAGRPNAGKSTLTNAFVGENRVLTGAEAGTTRDAIAVKWQYEGRDIKLVDTAGMRKKARVKEKLEKLSVGDSLRSIQFAHVVLLIIDATLGFEKQDLTLADLVHKEGRTMVVVANKWDLVKKKKERLKELSEDLDYALPQLRGVSFCPISAAKDKNFDKIMHAVFDAYDVWNKRISTSKLNDFLESCVEAHPPPLVSGRRLKLKFMTQIKTRPPTFVVFCNKSKDVPESYRRYLIARLREVFSFPGVPVRLLFKSGKNPYAENEK